MHSTRHTINLNTYILSLSVEAVALHCDQLAASGVPLFGIDRVDHSESFSLVASIIGIVAPDHSVLLVESVAHSEPEVHLCRLIWRDGSHIAANLIFSIRSENNIFLKERFKVNTVAVDAHLSEGVLWESLASFVLSRAWVYPEGKLGARVDNRGRHVVENWSVGSAVINAAVRRWYLWITL